MQLVMLSLIIGLECVILSPCISNQSRTGIPRPPSCCARAIGTARGSRSAPLRTFVRRALPHGHVAAVLGTLRDIGLHRILGPTGNRPRDLVVAMIVARLIAPASKLATARLLDPATGT